MADDGVVGHPRPTGVGRRPRWIAREVTRWATESRPLRLSGPCTGRRPEAYLDPLRPRARSCSISPNRARLRCAPRRPRRSRCCCRSKRYQLGSTRLSRHPGPPPRFAINTNTRAAALAIRRCVVLTGPPPWVPVPGGTSPGPFEDRLGVGAGGTIAAGLAAARQLAGPDGLAVWNQPCYRATRQSWRSRNPVHPGCRYRVWQCEIRLADPAGARVGHGIAASPAGRSADRPL